jgi:hypothetical protein
MKNIATAFPAREARLAALACVAVLLASCGGSSTGVPSQLSRFPEDLRNAEINASGIYEDAWVADTAAVDLEQPDGKQAVTVRGTVPQVADAGFRTEVDVRVDGRSVARRTLGPGDFQIAAPVEGEPGKRRIEVGFSRTQELPGADGRAVGARLQFLGFEPASAAVREGPADIIASPGMQLGEGWEPLETFRNETFRWVDNDAQLVVTPFKGEDANLLVTLEPGPSTGRPMVLKVLDASGRQIDAVRVQRRQTVELLLPVEAGKPNEFRLHVDGGGKPALNDPRILNFRVFRIESAPERPTPQS